MSHFAKLDADNYVIFVTVGRQEDDGKENELCARTGDMYRQTSYTGRIRKNYAGIGYTYDAVRDAFIPPRPFPSWLLDEDTCLWQPPTPYPDNDGMYAWDEDTQTWVAVQQ
jgi:hypothetical protein